MGFRIVPMDTAQPRQRRPRVEEGTHLAFIRTLPCVVCGDRPCDPAHLRTANRMLGKPEAGTAAKPDDRWTSPLCRTHHDEQHRGNELAFWVRHGIGNPWQLCLALYAVSGDLQEAETIIQRHRLL